MEALAAVSLAGNIVQFVSFAGALISKSNEIHSSTTGCTEGVLTVDTVYRRLGELSSYLRTCSQSDLIASAPLAHHVTTIKNLSRICKRDCDKLLEIVHKLKSDKGSTSPWHSSKVALKTIWKREYMTELEERLHKTQATLTLSICAITSDWQSIHQRNLTDLRVESQRFHLEQSSKLDQMNETLRSIESRILAAEASPSDDGFSNAGVSLLEQQMAQLSVSEEVVTKEQGIIKSLSFASRPMRHTSITHAHQQTFRWVFQKPTYDTTTGSKLISWLQEGLGIFWVSGKPGSGKSTFMKFVADASDTRLALKTWSAPKPVIIASHYFWSAGTEMQKSQQGLLQSLLYEIFRQCPDLIEPICGYRWSRKEQDLCEQWSLHELQTALREVASSQILSTKFCFFIDGLDEYAGDQFEICRALTELAKSPQIKLCVSSRPWNVFEEAFGQSFESKLYIHELTKGDIQRFVESRLQEHPRWTRAIGVPQREWMVKEITERASGVFLWVFLVTRLLRAGLTNRDSYSDLCRRLKSFPTELEPFFKQILESVEPFYHNKMATTLQITLTARSPLHIFLYNFHDQEYDDEDYALHMPVQPLTEERTSKMKEETTWRLNSLCHGLLEVDEQGWHVNFLHRTVMDFLKTREMSEFLAAKTPPKFESAICLMKAYTARFKSNSFSNASPLRRTGSGNFGGSSMVTILDGVLACAAEIEEQTSLHNADCYELLDEVEKCIKIMCAKKESNCDVRGSPLLAFFREKIIEAQLVKYLRKKLIEQPDYLSMLGVSVVPFLLYGSAEPSGMMRDKGVEMLRCALEAGEMDLNEVFHDERMETRWTNFIDYLFPWNTNDSVNKGLDIASKYLKSDVFALLFQHEADPNALVPCVGTSRNRTPYFSVAFVNFLRLSFNISPETAHELAYLEVLDEFLKHGADLKASPRLSNIENHRSAVTTETALDRYFTDLVSFGIHNLPFLAKVTEKLLCKAREEGMELRMEYIQKIIRKAFPGKSGQRLKSLVAGEGESNGDFQRCRKRQDRDVDRLEERPNPQKTLLPAQVTRLWDGEGEVDRGSFER